MNDMTSENKKPLGCCGCLLYGLGIVIVLILVVVGGGYYTLMHSSYPLRKIAEAIEQTAPSDAPITIQDVSGSFSTGARIKHLKWKDGEVENLCITYDNLFRSLRDKRFIFREISVTKAHISVLESLTSGTASERPIRMRDNDDTPADWDLFQIDKLALSDIVLSNKLTGVTVVIPKFEWIGFRWEKEQTQFGTINADTPAFKLVTGDAKTPGFLKSFKGEIRPGLHPSVLKAIPFEIECGKPGKNMPCHLSAFGQAVTGDFRDDGSGTFKIQGLDLSAYFKDLLQKDIQLDITFNSQDKESSFQLKSGSFTLGKFRFAVMPPSAKISEEDQSDKPVLVAIAEGEGVKITYTVREKESGGGFGEELSSEPAMSPDKLMAILFFGKPFEELNAAEKEIVAERKKRFIPRLILP
jgi:hypothetical protein